jgi:hypothetical protein
MADEDDALDDKFPLTPARGVAVGLVIGTLIWIVIVIVVLGLGLFHSIGVADREPRDASPSHSSATH